MIGKALDRIVRYKNRTHALHFARGQIARWTREHLEEQRTKPYRVLDLGMGSGADLEAIHTECVGLDPELFGIDTKPASVRAARERREDVRAAGKNGVESHSVDLESEPLPFEDSSMDVVLANHVIEHLKQLFWVFSEISRILKPGGIAIIGCPNLGAWQNRCALLIGIQPPCMKLLGPHVRGITKSGLTALVQAGGYFEVTRYRGTNFYPLPSGPNQVFSAIFPTLAASHHFVLRRTSKPGVFIEVLEKESASLSDTPFFRGPLPKSACHASDEGLNVPRSDGNSAE